MKKIILLLIILIFISGCAEKECKVKEDCPDKTCFSKDCIDYNCSYSQIIPCCGNDKCEIGENYKNCVDDCPNCDDNYKCTEDSFDYNQHECLNKKITPCCDNGKCEPGETYKECADDCVKTGHYKKSEIWGGTIHVTGDITIEEKATLTILPGTIIEVAAMSDDQHGGVDHPPDPPFPKDPDRTETQSTGIRINGILNAIGTENNKIIFTSDSETPTTYDWDGLGISHGRLEYAIVEYSRYNNFQESSDVIVANNIFRNMLECCICIGHSKPISPQILNNDIYNCGHEGIDYAGGSALIKGNYFHVENPEIQPDPSRGRVGIVVYENSYPIIEDNIFKKLSRDIIFNSNSMHEREEGKSVIIKNNIYR